MISDSFFILPEQKWSHSTHSQEGKMAAREGQEAVFINIIPWFLAMEFNEGIHVSQVCIAVESICLSIYRTICDSMLTKNVTN